MKKILLIILLISAFSFANGIDGSFSTGFYWGTPYWNSDNFSEEIDPADTFMRSVNHLRLNGRFFNNLTVRMHALRNDGFQSENRMSETKIYQVYAQYDFSFGMVKAGRFAPMNRWIKGSLDGGAFCISASDKIKFSVTGGMYSPYGKFYDSDNTLGLGYADVSFRMKQSSIKVKAYADEDITKAGTDFYTKLGRLNVSGNYGFDFTNERIADGGLNLFYILNKKLSVSGNYRLYRTDDWKFSFIELPSLLIERFSLGARYKLFSNYYLDLRQLVTMTTEQNNYLSYLNFHGKYFYVGVNYLTGDTQYERLGILVGGKYTLFKTLNLSAGIAPVDYLLSEDQDHQQSIAYYFRLGYTMFNSLNISANFNFYQDNPALESATRGGIQIRYNFGG